MKKYIFIFFLLIITTMFACYASDADFASSLRNCSHYTESGLVNTDGMSVKTTKKILGRQGDKCTYKEEMEYSGLNIAVTCKFTQPQINEITSVMNAYSLIQKYSDENIDIQNSQDVQNNPVVKVWNKYLQNSSVCKIDELQ